MAIDPPGTPLAAFLGLALADELLDTLVAEGVITADSRARLLQRLLARVEQSPKAVAQQSAEVLRNALLGQN